MVNISTTAVAMTVFVIALMVGISGTAAADVQTGWALGTPNTHNDQYVLVDFEEGVNSYNPVVCPVPGITFETMGGTPWVYACVDGRLNLRNETTTNGGGAYIVNGYAGAWCGLSGDGGKVIFDYPVSHVSCLASLGTNLIMVAYDSNDNEVVNSSWAGSNTFTGTFARLSVDRAETDISYVIIHDSGNFWLIDDLVVGRKATFVIGDVFNNATEPITVNWADNTGSCDVTLSYDESIVLVTAVAGGDMSNNFANLDSAGDGSVRIGAYQGGDPGLSGTFVLANVTFERVADGTCPLNITVITYKDSTPAGVVMEYTVKNGVYCSYDNGDVNGDGIVDIHDALYLAHYVIGIPAYSVIIEQASDVDGNGIIDIHDASYLAKHVLGIDGYEDLL